MDSSRPPVGLVAAVARNGVIGRDGGMPWRLPTDLAHFRRLTMGRPVIMGRRTFEGFARPLKGRTNVVVTRDRAYGPAGVVVAHSLGEALAAAAAADGGETEVFVIGGGQLYAEALPLADRLHITHVDADPDGDTRFPAIDPAVWVAASAEDLPRSDKDTAGMRYVLYERRLPRPR